MLLQFKAVQKYYFQQRVLDIADFTFQGGIYWVRGENGSGKTTLLKMTAGLIPFNGEIILNGISLPFRPRRYRQLIGWAEAEPKYPGIVSGQDLIDLYRAIRKSTHREVNSLISYFNFNEYINIPTAAYSSGMLKKLSLILAFIGKPSLILLDEPFTTLDTEAAKRARQLIQDYHLQSGTTFLIASHHDFVSFEVGTYCKRVLIEEHTLKADQ